VQIGCAYIERECKAILWKEKSGRIRLDRLCCDGTWNKWAGGLESDQNEANGAGETT
jgi:hypothetical protein